MLPVQHTGWLGTPQEFTNLTRDHLDYHADMQSYAAAKSALFSHRGVVAAVINTDDLTGRALVKQFASQLGYAPLPRDVVKQELVALEKVKVQ